MDELVRFAPVVTAIGVIIGSAAAWATLFLYYRKSQANQWVESFRAIYADFWTNGKVSMARRWIDNDREYIALREVLLEVMEKKKFDLSESEYNYIENIDQFLAIMLRVTSFIGRNRQMDKEQRWLWFNMFQRYWVPRIYSRPELSAYVKEYWRSLDGVMQQELQQRR